MAITGILCGYASERDVASLFPESLCAVSGARVDLATARAEELVKRGATRLLSFGLAGALAPDLEVGDLIVATRVLSGDKIWEADAAFHNALMQGIGGAQCGAVYASDVVVDDTAFKRALFGKTQALIVDMESQCVAEVAARAGVPFGVLRVVSDTQNFSIPPAALCSLDEQGNVALGPVLRSLLRAPGQMGALMALGRHSAFALKQLRKAVQRLAAAS